MAKRGMIITSVFFVVMLAVALLLSLPAVEAASGSKSGINSSSLSIPDGCDTDPQHTPSPGCGAWVSSSITISGAPSNATVTGIDVYFEIKHTCVEDLIVEIGSYRLLDLPDGYCTVDIKKTVSGITDFNGQSPNGAWNLWAIDEAYVDTGSLDSWSITVHYVTPKSTTSLQVLDKQVALGQTVTLAAKLTSFGSPVASKRVDFAVAGGGCTDFFTDFNGLAECSYTPPLAVSPGDHQIVATFQEDADFYGTMAFGTLKVLRPCDGSASGSSPAMVVALFTGFLGSINPDQTGIEKLCQHLLDRSTSSRVIVAKRFGHSEQSAAISFLNSPSFSSAEKILIGHSWGGDSAIEVANSIDGGSGSFSKLVQIDSVGIGDDKKPANVASGLNYFQSSTNGDLQGEKYVEGSINIDAEKHFGKQLTHTGIDDDPGVQTEIIAFVVDGISPQCPSPRSSGVFCGPFLPTANAGGPYTGNKGDSITLNASQSADPDGNIAQYEWDLDGDGQFNDASGVKPSHVFSVGSFNIWLRVTDDSGYTDTANTQVSIVDKPGELSVTPVGGLTSSGLERGPFSPSSKQYTLTNIGGTVINWSASSTEGWTSLSPAGGSLDPGSQTIVTASISNEADSLPPNKYPATITFLNITNGLGDTTRPVGLEVICYTDLTLANMQINGKEIFRAKNSISAGPSFSIENGADVTFRAGSEIRLLPGFEAKSGSEYRTEIRSNPCQ